MKRILLSLLLVPFVALAQTAAPLPQEKMPPLPPVVSPLKVPNAPPGGTPNLCDQSFAAVTETAGTNRVMYTPPVTMFAVPFADAQANHDLQVKVLKELAKQQNKGGDYTITVTETVDCDKAGNARITDGSLYVEGVTLMGTVEVADVILAVGKEINDRYRARAKFGMKTGWNHKNAKPVKRNDVGQIEFDK